MHYSQRRLYFKGDITEDTILRYYLCVPIFKRRQAILAGCEYDPERKRWYVEPPFKPPLTLADFAQWNPYRIERSAKGVELEINVPV